MIPSIETIIEDLLAGTITKPQAISWLHQHAQDACEGLRDGFAVAILPHVLQNESGFSDVAAKKAYEYADEMMKARGSPGDNCE